MLTILLQRWIRWIMFGMRIAGSYLHGMPVRDFADIHDRGVDCDISCGGSVQSENGVLIDLSELILAFVTVFRTVRVTDHASRFMYRQLWRKSGVCGLNTKCQSSRSLFLFLVSFGSKMYSSLSTCVSNMYWGNLPVALREQVDTPE